VTKRASCQQGAMEEAIPLALELLQAETTSSLLTKNLCILVDKRLDLLRCLFDSGFRRQVIINDASNHIGEN